MRLITLLLLVTISALPQALDRAKLAAIAPRLQEFVDRRQVSGHECPPVDRA